MNNTGQEGMSMVDKGSHVIFVKEGVAEILNLQPIGNNAKSYQVRQVRDLIIKYQLEID